MRRVRGARRMVEEEWLVGGHRLLVAHPLDGLVGHVVVEVVACRMAEARPREAVQPVLADCDPLNPGSRRRSIRTSGAPSNEPSRKPMKLTGEPPSIKWTLLTNARDGVRYWVELDSPTVILSENGDVNGQEGPPAGRG
jgi:hypothetical protein